MIMAESNYSHFKPIKQWAEDERPREKLCLKGKSSLSNAELLAIIIGSGSKDRSALDLARDLLNQSQNSLIELSKMDRLQLQKIKGIGQAKAILIESVIEFGRRRQHAEALEKTKISSSQEAHAVLKAKMQDLNHEEFWVIFLNRSNKMISLEQFSRGGITGTVADARMIYSRALHWRSVGIILAHNHPSGSIKPSQQDIELTKKMKSAGQNLDIAVLDHLILTEDNYFSFADEGLL